MLYTAFAEGLPKSALSPERIIKNLEATRTERELALREAIVERKNAYKLAESRERLTWVAPTGLLTAGLSAYAALHHRNAMYSLPIIPIVAYVANQAHMAYGNKMSLLMKTTEHVILDPASKLSTRPISLQEIDARVDQGKEAAVLSCVDLSD